jgi:hypothetical protein
MKIKFAAYALTLFTILSCNSNAQTKKLSLEPKKDKQLLFCWGLFWCSERIWSSSWCRRSYFRICRRNYILLMNKLVLTILVMLKLLPYTMTQSYFFQGIRMCFRVTRPDNSQSTRARSWFFLSLYCLL